VSSEIPETSPGRSGLSRRMPGYDPSVPLDKQKGDEPSSSTVRAVYFTATFTQLAVSLGHIFRVDTGDIDMRDVMLNRRILVVNRRPRKFGRHPRGTRQARRGVVARDDGAAARRLARRRLHRADKPGMGPAPFPSCSTSSPITRRASRPHLAMGAASTLLHARLSGVSGLGAARRKDGLPARQRQSHDCNAPAGLGTHARMDREDRRQTYITQPPHIMARRRCVSRGAPRRSTPGLARRLERLDDIDRGEAIVLFGGRRI